MNHEAEKKLFATLLPKETDKNVPIPNYPRLNRELVHQVSKNITRIVYDSLKTDNNSSKSSRDAIISLLLKWSRNNNENHLNITSQNRDVIVKYLNSINNKKIDPLFDDFYNESLTKCVEKNLWSNIYETFKRVNEYNANKKTSKDLISALDSLQLRNCGFICSVPNKIIEKNDFERTLSALKLIVNEDNENVNMINLNTKTTAMIGKTNNSVALGYALLNMDRNKENQELFLKIFEELLNKAELSNEETEFLNYLWMNEKKLNLSHDVSKKIMNSCSFLYERPLLEISCHVMSTNVSDYNKIITQSSLLNILSCLKENKSLYFNVKNCLYELYILSNYDQRIKQLLLYFNDRFL